MEVGCIIRIKSIQVLTGSEAKFHLTWTLSATMIHEKLTIVFESAKLILKALNWYSIYHLGTIYGTKYDKWAQSILL